MNSEPPAFPKAIDDDDDDVAWALQTAAVQWERGGHADAVVWLRRAAQAAVESGEFGRAADLERGAREVERWVERGVVGPAPDEDDGVDSLLDGPAIEAGSFEGPSPSLVDLLEREGRDEEPSTEDLGDDDIEDLPDVQDVEDIEQVGAEELASQPDDQPPVSEAAPLPLRSRRPPAASRPPKPSESRPPKPSESPSKPSGSRPSKPSESRRVPAVSDAPDAATLKPPAGGYKLPPPPIPRLPLPAPRRSPPPAAPPADPGSDNDSATATPLALSSQAPGSFDAPTHVNERVDAPVDLPPPRPQLLSETEPELLSGEIELPPAPIAAPSAPPPAPQAEPVPSSRVLAASVLAAVRGLEDLPPETQAELAARAKVEVLAPEQEVSGFGLALVTNGSVLVMPTIADAACGRAVEGEPIFSQGNLTEGVPLRAVAESPGAEVAVWQRADFDHLLETCHWVAEELRAVADRYQAFAGAAMGPLGEHLDDGMRAMVTERAEVRYLKSGDVALEQGKPVAGLLVVGGGHVELVVDGSVTQTLGPGDLPFASAVLSHAKAPASVRAGEQGALVVTVDRMATHELLVSVPPLLELLATS